MSLSGLVTTEDVDSTLSVTRTKSDRIDVRCTRGGTSAISWQEIEPKKQFNPGASAGNHPVKMSTHVSIDLVMKHSAHVCYGYVRLLD